VREGEFRTQLAELIGLIGLAEIIAKALGLDVPLILQQRADEVIE
jgi:hypothetical protein